MTNGVSGTASRAFRLNVPQRIMLITTALAAVAVALFVIVVRPLPGAPTALNLPWLLWAAAFAISEAFPVHVQVKKDSHTFSVSDLVLAAGLVLSIPSHLVIAQVVGVAGALLVPRRQRGLKLAFNTALFALTGTAATTIYAVLSAPMAQTWYWLAALAAVLGANLVGNACIFAVISVSEGRVDLGKFVEMCTPTVPAAIAAAAIGLVVARTVVNDPAALALLALPTTLIIVAYRAFTKANLQQENLRRLHEVTALLHHGDSHAALGEFLTSVRSAFRAEMAELLLLDTSDRELPTVSTSREGREPVALKPLVDQSAYEGLLRLATAAGVLTTRAGVGRGGQLDAYASDRGLKDTIAAVLRTDDRVHGLLLIGGRHGEVSSFTDEDLALLETFSRHVGTSLERGRLEETLRQVTDLKEQLRHQALHDPLTDLPNRTLFIDRVRHAVAAAARTLEWPAVLYLDLDGFKPVNDTHGHEAGDQLLRTVADRLQNCLRAGDTAARLGGDEFAVLLEGPLDEERVGQVVDRIRRHLGTPVDLGGGRIVSVGASIGIAVGEPGTHDADSLIKRADVAMYSAKRSGGNAACIHRPELDDGGPEPIDPATELQGAVERGELHAVFQPLIDLRTGQLTGAEALVRWEHPTDGVRMPDEFIGLAEETGLIIPIGAQVLRDACAAAARWVQSRPDLSDLLVSV